MVHKKKQKIMIFWFWLSIIISTNDEKCYVILKVFDSIIVVAVDIEPQTMTYNICYRLVLCLTTLLQLLVMFKKCLVGLTTLVGSLM